MKQNVASYESLALPIRSPSDGAGSEGATETGRLKVLVLDEEVPYPLNSGKRIRTWNILSRLAKKHAVTLLCYGPEADSARAAITEAGISLQLVEPQGSLEGFRLYSRLFLNVFSREPFSVAKHYSSRFLDRVGTLVRESRWDLIHCEWTPYARYVSQLRSLPVVISAHNVECEILERRSRTASNFVSKAFFRTQAYKMRRFEKASLQRATGVTAVTENDLETMREWGVRSASVAPNGVDLSIPVPRHESETDEEILFLASLDWHANVDALDHFTANIFPHVLAESPNSRLRIVGRRPSPSLVRRYSNLPGVDFVGEVADVRPFVARAAMVIVPLRVGGGSRIKILEALASEKAVVSTSVGAEGLDIVPGEHLIIADKPEDFARRIFELQKSKAARRELGRNGRRLIEQNYGWDGIASRVEAAWFAAVRQHRECQKTPQQARS